MAAVSAAVVKEAVRNGQTEFASVKEFQDYFKDHASLVVAAGRPFTIRNIAPLRLVTDHQGGSLEAISQVLNRILAPLGQTVRISGQYKNPIRSCEVGEHLTFGFTREVTLQKDREGLVIGIEDLLRLMAEGAASEVTLEAHQFLRILDLGERENALIEGLIERGVVELQGEEANKVLQDLISSKVPHGFSAVVDFLGKKWTLSIGSVQQESAIGQNYFQLQGVGGMKIAVQSLTPQGQAEEKYPQQQRGSVEIKAQLAPEAPKPAAPAQQQQAQQPAPAGPTMFIDLIGLLEPGKEWVLKFALENARSGSTIGIQNLDKLIAIPEARRLQAIQIFLKISPSGLPTLVTSTKNVAQEQKAKQGKLSKLVSSPLPEGLFDPVDLKKIAQKTAAEQKVAFAMALYARASGSALEFVDLEKLEAAPAETQQFAAAFIQLLGLDLAALKAAGGKLPEKLSADGSLVIVVDVAIIAKLSPAMVKMVTAVLEEFQGQIQCKNQEGIRHLPAETRRYFLDMAAKKEARAFEADRQQRQPAKAQTAEEMMNAAVRELGLDYDMNGRRLPKKTTPTAEEIQKLLPQARQGSFSFIELLKLRKASLDNSKTEDNAKQIAAALINALQVATAPGLSKLSFPDLARWREISEEEREFIRHFFQALGISLLVALEDPSNAENYSVQNHRLSMSMMGLQSEYKRMGFVHDTFINVDLAFVAQLDVARQLRALTGAIYAKAGGREIRFTGMDKLRSLSKDQQRDAAEFTTMLGPKLSHLKDLEQKQHAAAGAAQVQQAQARENALLQDFPLMVVDFTKFGTLSQGRDGMMLMTALKFGGVHHFINLDKLASSSVLAQELARDFCKQAGYDLDQLKAGTAKLLLPEQVDLGDEPQPADEKAAPRANDSKGFFRQQQRPPSVAGSLSSSAAAQAAAAAGPLPRAPQKPPALSGKAAGAPQQQQQQMPPSAAAQAAAAAGPLPRAPQKPPAPSGAAALDAEQALAQVFEAMQLSQLPDLGASQQQQRPSPAEQAAAAAGPLRPLPRRPQQPALSDAAALAEQQAIARQYEAMQLRELGSQLPSVQAAGSPQQPPRPSPAEQAAAAAGAPRAPAPAANNEDGEIAAALLALRMQELERERIARQQAGNRGNNQPERKYPPQ